MVDEILVQENTVFFIDDDGDYMDLDMGLKELNENVEKIIYSSFY